jgi:hypothetical protein
MGQLNLVWPIDGQCDAARFRSRESNERAAQYGTACRRVWVNPRHPALACVPCGLTMHAINMRKVSAQAIQRSGPVTGWQLQRADRTQGEVLWSASVVGAFAHHRSDDCRSVKGRA